MKKEFNSVTDKSPQNNQQKGFSKTLAQHLHLKDERLYYTHSNENLLRQKIYQFITENAQGDAANQLMNDPDLTEIIGTDAASQPSLSRFIHDLMPNP
ncbi:transposase [Gracilibacillus boraciitolerans JCM 21714]|uniref:Transposase n=1 Tax=Gracilibacillus boraciitolerans JCM 21714 TaxID=1298598 RepID=W4VIR1_9BACI|nr:transposase [Gracilibacillus boraciitolerans]GAE93097.1 transposase [Gracilibacillus boraciitolerans JCM 21714]